MKKLDYSQSAARERIAFDAVLDAIEQYDPITKTREENRLLNNFKDGLKTQFIAMAIGHREMAKAEEIIAKKVKLDEMQNAPAHS